jgi:hypothetical protein
MACVTEVEARAVPQGFGALADQLAPRFARHLQG